LNVFEVHDFEVSGFRFQVSGCATFGEALPETWNL
jgi:hypothetical protein